MPTEVCEPELATAPASTSAPTPTRRTSHLRASLIGNAIFAVIAAALAAFPKTRHLLWSMLYLIFLQIGSTIFAYLRDFHPNLFPATLDPDSFRLLELKRLRKILNWTALAGLSAIVVSAVAILSFSGCVCEDHPIAFFVSMGIFATVGLLSATGSSLLSTYIKQSTVAFARTRTRNLSGVRKPFHSDHWGEPVRPFEG